MPKKVKLPDGRGFFAKYQRVARNALPKNIRVRRTYTRKIGSRRQQKWRNQAGRGLNLLTEDLISTADELGKKTAMSSLGKMVIKDAIDYIPTAYKKLKNKITNKKAKAALNTGIDNFILNRDIKLVGELLN